MTWLFSKALMQDFENSRSLPELAVESLVVTCSDGEPYAQLNVMPTPHKFWRNDKTMESSDLSRFGLTLRLLTDDHGAALLTWFREASLARTSASLGMVTASMVSEADYGWKCEGSFVRYDQDASTWRTRQCSLLGGLEEFSATWPSWGSMRGGECLEHTTPMLPTSDRGFGFWPTPVASMAKGSSPASLTRKNGRDRSKDRLDHAIMASDGGQLNPTWVEWLMGWPIGWTDLKPLAMAKFREWQQQHGAF